ncbi:MAG: hypothetical protein AAB710_02460 [Patescibacteria group bacterium]
MFDENDIKEGTAVVYVALLVGAYHFIVNTFPHWQEENFYIFLISILFGVPIFKGLRLVSKKIYKGGGYGDE